MKTIGVINFRGGVGKTTLTYLLSRYITEKMNKKVLLIDMDPQMSLTQLFQLDEGKGEWNKKFKQWYNQYKGGKNTLVNAIEDWQKTNGTDIDFHVNSQYLYKLSDNLLFLPTTTDLYWLNYDLDCSGKSPTQKEDIKGFFTDLQKRISQSLKYKFDYIFVDCPSDFTTLTYSIISSTDELFIPVNPNVLAGEDLIQMIEGLTMRIKPWHDLRISVFMNKAKTLKDDYLTGESKKYISELNITKSKIEKKGIKIDILNSYLPARIDLQSGLTDIQFPYELETYFGRLWSEMSRLYN